MLTKKIFKATALSVMLLGSIHLAATPFIFPVFKNMPYQSLSSLYMFVIVGICTVFLGWLQLFSLERRSDDNGYNRILSVTVIFILIIGTGAVASMWQNPFAYVCLLIALFQIFLLSKNQSHE